MGKKALVVGEAATITKGPYKNDSGRLVKVDQMDQVKLYSILINRTSEIVRYLFMTPLFMTKR